MDASEVELYEAAGVDLTTVEAARRELRSLDLFQTGSVRAESIVQFRKLTDLVLIHVPRLTQPTCDFTPLSVLQRVTIIECQLVSLECLSLCDSLESVVVDGNQLTSLEPLTSARLPRLRKLWANDNQIASLASLGRLNAVEELSLARNEIATVGHSLDDLAALTSLNLSDNRIGHFREVRQIARLPALRELALSDAHWGDNPVCGLCNYGTFTLCQLPHLQVLDTIVLDEGAKTAAEATFSKKRMYYNMRIKTLKRNTYNVVHRAGVALRSRARALRGGARLLHRSLRDVRRELRFDYAALLLHIRSTELGRESTGDAAAPDQCKAGRGTMALAAATSEALAGYEAASDTAGRLDCLGSPLQPLLDSASPLDDIATNALAAQIRALERLQQRLLWAVAERTLAERSLRWQLSALRETLHGIAAMRTRRLVLELTTGGNIRLEDGTARQVWFRSCADLVQSRFHSRDFASVGVTGVRVRGVTRIHNRHLRAQFDRKMAALLAADEELAQAFASGSQATGPAGFTDAASASSLAADALLASKAALAADVASTGLLKPPGDSAALGHDAMPHEAEPRGVWGSGAAFSSPAVQGGVLVVCKVFMGRCATAEEAVAAQRAAVVAEAKDVASSLMARQEAAAGGATEVLGEYELQEALASAEAATRSGEDLGDGSGEAAGTFGDASPTSRRSVAGGGQQFSALAGWPSQSALRAKRHASVDTPKSMCHSVVSQRRDDPRQRQWVILDPELALPEYIVDFEYVWEVAGGTTVPAAAQQPQAPELGMDGDAAGDARNRTMGEELTLLAEVSLGGRAGRAGDGDVDGEDEETVGGGTAVRLSPQEESDLKPLVRPLARFVELCRGVGATFAADGEAQAEALELAAARVSRTLPELRHGPRDAMVDYLASSAGSKGLLTLRELLSREATLDLHGSGMTSLQVFSGPKQVWSGIRSLVLSFCGLYSLDGIGEGLAALPALTSLDVSFNSIDSLLFSAAAARADGNGTAASSSGAGGPGAGGGAHNRCALAAAPRLKRLLLHDNRISSLGDLPALAEACPRLEELSLAYNPVSLAHMDAERPRGLAPHGIWTGGATELGELALLGLLPVGPPVLHGKGLLPERVVLTGTPWRPHLPGVGGSVSHTRYRSIVLASLPSLQTLDGCALSRPHDATAGGSSSLGGDRGAGTEIVMRQATDTLGERVWPELDDAAVSTAEHGGLPGAPAPSADVLAGEEATREGGDGWAAGQRVSAAKTATVGSVAASTAVLAPARVAPPSTSVVQLAEEAERWASVHAVDVSGCSLQSLAGPGLGRCMNLRRLDASANLLSSLDSLAANRLPKLEELVLEDNRVGSLLDRTGAAALSCVSSSLLRLDLGSNCLTELRGLSSLKRLVQLSVENNELTSIEGLSELSSLLELYAGNNKIRAVKEVRRLRELPKLIILDLCGNPLCGASKYRLFTVYHLRRLKVLDGVSITADEHQEARERYSGRMTVDFLEEKLGAERLATVAELDLSNCRIRDIERLPASRFQCLSKLNLTGNVLTAHGLRGLRQLPHLRELLLPSNKVSTLLPAVQEDPDDADTGEPGDGTAAAESAFAGIQSLDLSSNAVSSIEGLGLSFLPGLRVLNLSRNDVGRLRRVDGCGQLRELSLAANRLRSIDEGALSALRSLRILQLQENGLKVLSALTVLQTLQVLNLSSNRVSDIREVENLAALPYLVDLTLTSNPVARKQLYRPTVLRSLDLLRKLDGREASEEEKAHAAQLFAEGGGTMPGIYMGGGSTEVGGPSAASMAGRVPVRMAAVSFGNVLATSSGSSTAPMQQLQGHMMMQQAQLQMRVSSPRAQAGGMATVAAASASTAGMMGRAGLRVAHGISAAAARDTSLSVGVKPMGLATVGIASGRDASAGLAAAGRAATRWGAAAGVAPSRPRMSYLSAGGLSARGVGQVGAAATRTGHRQVRRARVSPRGARGTSTTEVGGDRPGRR